MSKNTLHDIDPELNHLLNSPPQNSQILNLSLSFNNEDDSLKPLFLDDSFNNIKPIFNKCRRRKKMRSSKKKVKRKMFKEFSQSLYRPKRIKCRRG